MGERTSEEQKSPNLPIAAKVIAGIADIGIIFSNLIILVALIRSSKLRKNVYTLLVLTLTVSDLLIGLYSAIALLMYDMRFFNRATCSLMLHIFMTGVATSLYNTFLICVNRLLAAFAKEQLSRSIFIKNLKKIVICTWVLIQVYLLFTIFLQSRNDIHDVCSYETLFGDNSTIMRRVLVVLHLPVFVLTIILYLITLIRIHRYYKRNKVHTQIVTVSDQCDRSVQQTANAAPNAGVPHKRHMLGAIKTLGLVIFALTAFTGPFVLSLVIFALGHNLSRDIVYLVSVLVILNSLTNPIIYTLRFQELRSELKSIAFNSLKFLTRITNECRICRCNRY